MASRLVTYLHPVAGRPLVWHTVAGLAGLRPAPERVVVVAGVELAAEAFADLPVQVEVVRAYDLGPDRLEPLLPADPASHALVIDAAAHVTEAELRSLLAGPSGGWLGDARSEPLATWTSRSGALHLLAQDEPLRRLPADGTADALGFAHRVRDRVDLSRVVFAVRDRLVQRLMRGGATFLLPDSVLVDVDVRIGRDSIVYPGVVLEGQTTIGEETVVGPGCRVIDSWIGSGVELKGWNYVSHTSIRNRAILEPYVRRGFD